MSETAFTSGPWLREPDTAFLYVLTDGVNRWFANFQGQNSGVTLAELRACAQLASSAPDLYEACAKTYLNLLTTSPEPWRTHNQPILCALREALAKAEGVDEESLQDRFEAKARGEQQ